VPWHLSTLKPPSDVVLFVQDRFTCVVLAATAVTTGALAVVYAEAVALQLLFQEHDAVLYALMR